MNIPRYIVMSIDECESPDGEWCKWEDVEQALAQPPDHLSILRKWRDGLKNLEASLKGLFTPCPPGCTECILHRLDGLIAHMEGSNYPSRNEPIGIEKKTH